MAKELPYFKFEPNQWDNGLIQMYPRAVKGLFIDLCSSYWSRLGDMPYAFVLQKLCNGEEDVLQELLNSEIITVNDNKIHVEFLDEQLRERAEISEKRAEVAKERWKNANDMQLHSKRGTIKKRREEKRKEENRKEDIHIPAWDEFKEYSMVICEETGKNYSDFQFSIKGKYDSWKEAGWKDGNGKKIKNWKTKFRNSFPYLKPVYSNKKNEESWKTSL